MVVMNKLTDMGTTGLIEYAAGFPTTKLRALAIGRVRRVLKQRGYPAGALWKFSQAVYQRHNAKAQ